MVWTGGLVSIRLPFDATDGGGTNYIDIGEAIPPEVADRFKAAIVFRNGNPNLQQYGFVYWVFGINVDGALEIAGYMYQNNGNAYEYKRQTILSVDPPVGVDKLPVLQLGYDSFYGGSYNEKGVDLRFPKSSRWVDIGRGDTGYFYQHPTQGQWVNPPGMSAGIFVPEGYEIEVQYGVPTAFQLSGIAQHRLFIDGVVVDSAVSGGDNSNYQRIFLTGSKLGPGSFYVNPQFYWQSGGQPDIRAGSTGVWCRYRLCLIAPSI